MVNKLKPEVREKLLEIAQDFFESLDLPEGTQLKDIKLTGSLANYNWSKFSDFDLHLVLDFSEIDDDEEFVRNYFMAKKGIWNDAHNINIYNFPVEVYVENEGESHTASGLYSILKDEWIVIPKKKEVMIDKDDISTKAEDYISQFEDVQKLYNDGEYEKVIDKVDKTKERLRNMRSSGLEKGGEYSVENLAFKVLRRTDIIGQLNNLKSKSYDTMMSINEGMWI
jgi:muramidase (phage lysozyme)